jgi:TPR repeat protein
MKRKITKGNVFKDIGFTDAEAIALAMRVDLAVEIENNNQEHAIVQYNLGVMYDNGEGVPQDYKTALKWWTLAAEQGNAKAQFNLGLMYENGDGVPQDDESAVKWYTLAAVQGDAKAQYNLCVMYAQRRGFSSTQVNLDALDT